MFGVLCVVNGTDISPLYLSERKGGHSSLLCWSPVITKAIQAHATGVGESEGEDMRQSQST